MAKYRVIVREETSKVLSKQYEAASLQDAREIAEEDDWRTFDEDTSSTETEIIEVVAVD